MGVDMTDTDGIVTLRVASPAEIAGLVGRTFTTPWFQVDADRSEQFEFATYLDSYPHPYGGGGDEGGYGAGLVEGFHLIAMIDYLLNHVIRPEFSCIPWNYGLDHVRFVSVVRTTDRWRINGVITEVHDRGPQGWLLVADLTAQADGRERPAFVATQRFLWVLDDAVDH